MMIFLYQFKILPKVMTVIRAVNDPRVMSEGTEACTSNNRWVFPT